MGRKLLSCVWMLLFIFTGCSKVTVTSENKYKIVIVTGDDGTHSEEAIRGVNDLIRRYGSVEEDGIIQHVSYSKTALRTPKIFTDLVISIAKDPSVKAIVLNKAVKGTLKAFKKIRNERPDIMLLAAEPEENIIEIQAVSDKVASQDFVSRGVTIVWAARKLGADRFVHMSFQRHMENQCLNLQRQVMKEACEDLGLTFEAKTVRDPVYSTVPNLDSYIMSSIRMELATNGDKLAFFCTEDSYSTAIIRQLLESNAGIFVEASSPSPSIGYPEALGTDISHEKNNYRTIVDKLDEHLENRVAVNRFGTWVYSYSSALSSALGEYAKRVIEGDAEKDCLADLEKAFQYYTPGVKWRCSAYVNPETGSRAENHLLMYMDTYIFGGDILDTTSLAISPKYRNITSQ